MFISKAGFLAIYLFWKNLFKFVKMDGPRKGVNEPP